MEDDRVILLTEVPSSSTAQNATSVDDLELEAPSNSKTSSTSPSSIVYVAACVAAVGGILFGYDMGVISGAKAQMQSELSLSCAQVGVIVAALPAGGFIASLIGGAAVDKFGRKASIIFNAALFTAGALIVAFSSAFATAVLGRLVLGFAVSLSAIAECIYISEISTAQKRGMLVGLNELGITVGILVSFLINYIFATTPAGWRFMFGLSSALAIVQGFAMLFLPRTPQFLVIKRQEEKAEKVLRDLRLSTNVRQTLTDIRLSVNEASGSFLSLLWSNTDNVASRLLIGCGLVVFQQFSGQPNIIYYADDVFKQVNFTTLF